MAEKKKKDKKEINIGTAKKIFWIFVIAKAYFFAENAKIGRVWGTSKLRILLY